MICKFPFHEPECTGVYDEEQPACAWMLREESVTPLGHFPHQRSLLHLSTG